MPAEAYDEKAVDAEIDDDDDDDIIPHNRDRYCAREMLLYLELASLLKPTASMHRALTLACDILGFNADRVDQMRIPSRWTLRQVTVLEPF